MGEILVNTPTIHPSDGKHGPLLLDAVTSGQALKKEQEQEEGNKGNIWPHQPERK